MSSTKRLCCFFALALLLPLVAAEDCVLSTGNSDEFELEFLIQADGSAEMKMRFLVPYSQQCLEERNWEALSQTQGICPEDIVSDALFRTMGFFVIESDCTVSYETESSALVIETDSKMEKIAAGSDGFYEITFEKWEMVPHKAGAKNTLRIVLPYNGKLDSYFPKTNSVREANSIFWAEIPSEPTSIRYSLSDPIAENALIIGGLLVAVAVVVGLMLNRLRKQKKVEENLEKLDVKKEEVGKEMKEAQTSYLKRRIDENTFKSLMAKLQIRLNRIKAKKEAAEKKEKEEKQA